MTHIVVNETAISGARSDVDQLGGDLETAAFYPESMLRQAPTASAGRDTFIEAWDTRRNVEIDGIETLSLAFDLVLRAFVEADQVLADSLDTLGDVTLDTEGAQ